MKQLRLSSVIAANAAQHAAGTAIAAAMMYEVIATVDDAHAVVAARCAARAGALAADAAGLAVDAGHTAAADADVYIAAISAAEVELSADA